MQEIYRRDEPIIEKTEIDKETELIMSIIKTRRELDYANKNYEFADSDLIDYYIYQMKANQAKLDYLIKMAKVKGLNVNFIKDMEYSFYEQEEDVI